MTLDQICLVGCCDPCLPCGANFGATAFEGKLQSLSTVRLAGKLLAYLFARPLAGLLAINCLIAQKLRAQQLLNRVVG
jgi:hypothetical protein